MRRMLAGAVTATVLALGLVGGEGIAQSRQPHPFADVPVPAVCKGCSCKCGPGYRLPGKGCASWDQHREFKRKGAYPPGTVDELYLPTTQVNPGCPPQRIEQERSVP